MTLQVLRDNHLLAKFFECDIWLQEVNFLGHNISKNGVVVDLAKVQRIVEWQQLMSITDI